MPGEYAGSSADGSAHLSSCIRFVRMPQFLGGENIPVVGEISSSNCTQTCQLQRL